MQITTCDDAPLHLRPTPPKSLSSNGRERKSSIEGSLLRVLKTRARSNAAEGNAMGKPGTGWTRINAAGRGRDGI